jgi:hypothetical protein
VGKDQKKEKKLDQLTVSDAHSPNQPGEGFFVKHITNHPVRLTLKEATFWSASDDSTSVLATMLQKRQSL